MSGSPGSSAIDVASTISPPRMPVLPSLASYLDALLGHGLMISIGRMDCATCLCIRHAKAALMLEDGDLAGVLWSMDAVNEI